MNTNIVNGPDSSVITQAETNVETQGGQEEIEKLTELINHHIESAIANKRFATQLKTIRNKWLKDQTKLSKILKKSSKRKRNVSPAGFNKPVLVREDFAKFLEIDPAVPVNRTHVTKLLTTFFKENGLQNPENRREILLHKPEAKELRKFFPKYADSKPGDELLSYFNLQAQLKPLFSTPPSVETEAGDTNATKDVIMEDVSITEKSKLQASPSLKTTSTVPVKKVSKAATAPATSATTIAEKTQVKRIVKKKVGE